MQIRSFAERVLFSPDLRDKLAPPGSWIDTRPGVAVRGQPVPGRPAGLEAGSGASPRVGDLRAGRARGLLLHGFANHELLALELMALMLLRFPDAPAGFRAALMQTMADEQRHLRFYLGRMGSLGVEFGEAPLNDFFWRTVADAPRPIDYVARLALVFEQANLDHAHHTAQRMRSVGDEASAAVLDRVLIDEIGHVRVGLSWFRKWKGPAQTDWEAWRHLLVEPLSPARAKGPVFLREARLSAGLDPTFVDQLEVYGRSRGRPPNLWLFNPACEREWVRPGDVPGRAVAQLAADLDCLPLWLAGEDDVVLVQRLPRVTWLQGAMALGLRLAERVVEAPGALADRRVGEARPWGFSPAVQARLERVGVPSSGVSGDGHGKALSTQLETSILVEHGGPWLASGAACGVVCATPGAVAAALAARPGRNVIKGVFGAAGRDARRVGAVLTARDSAWVTRVLADQGVVVVEPWLDRLLDLSFHFDLGRDGRARFVGMARVFNDGLGQFQGTSLSPVGRLASAEVRRFLFGGPRGGRALRDVAALVGERVGPALAARGHVGPVGVDAFVFRAPGGALRLRPLVEINPRWTMGRVGLALSRRLGPRSVGVWMLLGRPALRKTGASSFASLAHAVGSDSPRIRDQRLVDGVVCTNDPSRARSVLGVMVGGADLASLRSHLGVLAPGHWPNQPNVADTSVA